MNLQHSQGYAVPAGQLHLQALKRQASFNDILRRGLPSRAVPDVVNQWRRANIFNLLRGAYKVWMAEKVNIATSYGALYLQIVRPAQNPSEFIKEYVDLYPTLCGLDFVTWSSLYRGLTFKRVNLGLASFRVVTTAGVNFIVDAFQNTTELENLKFHGIGTGSTAEAVGDTALVTELTTEYTPDSTRATGTTTEGASANIYRTVATNTLSGAGASLREHGIFSQAATGGGTLLDRTVYALITLADGDSLQSTYDHTQVAGS